MKNSILFVFLTFSGVALHGWFGYRLMACAFVTACAPGYKPKSLRKIILRLKGF